ncbi:hypothetical protein [Streptosporangium saharense]|uniref:hypothetical protein n=1 Tax=Streptosporangium saharense TaxID=1706840 RepID=UPI0033291EDE
METGRRVRGPNASLSDQPQGVEKRLALPPSLSADESRTAGSGGRDRRQRNRENHGGSGDGKTLDQGHGVPFHRGGWQDRSGSASNVTRESDLTSWPEADINGHSAIAVTAQHHLQRKELAPSTQKTGWETRLRRRTVKPDARSPETPVQTEPTMNDPDQTKPQITLTQFTIGQMIIYGAILVGGTFFVMNAEEGPGVTILRVIGILLIVALLFGATKLILDFEQKSPRMEKIREEAARLDRD